MRGARRAVGALLLVPFLALTSSLAPEHLHQRDADHPHSLIHSHLQPHDLAPHDHDGAEVEPGEAHVVWLNSAILCQSTYHVDPPVTVATALFEAETFHVSWSATTFDEGASAHGPPRRPTALRGPPHPLALI
jgi:hypothetical protein